MFRKESYYIVALVLSCLVLGAPSGIAVASNMAFSNFENTLINQDGSPDVQAGSHPWAMVTNFDFNDLGGDLKDVQFDLPPGLVGDPNAVEKCTIKQFTTPPLPDTRAPNSPATENCPVNSQVGVAEFKIINPALGERSYNLGLYNLVAPPGVPAELGVSVTGIPIVFTASVRTGTDNGLRINVRNASQAVAIYGGKVTVWGVPGSTSHDGLRGACLGGLGEEFASPGGIPCPSSEPAKPFLTMPTSCPALPPVARLRVDTWTNPGQFLEAGPASNLDLARDPVGLVGCDQLSFRPNIKIAPDTTHADSPAGLTAELKVPQDGLTAPEGLATATLQSTKVVLPVGVAINPGQAAGLEACQPSQAGIGTENAPSCPNASTVGTVEIKTPLLADPLKGNVYVLQSNPPDIRIMLAPSGAGVNLKLVGDVHLDLTTGQLTTTFADTPQLPFTDFKLTFNGGAQAALVTPGFCGRYSTETDFTPWSSPYQADTLVSDSFEIDSGPGGSPCVSQLPFGPTMIAGATTDLAGGFTDFSLLLQRGDGQQRVQSLQFKTPKGLLAMIRSVPLCPDDAAAAGSCSAESQIGHTVVAAGPGPYPLVVPQPGRPAAPIYVTGPYNGAPYGLSIAVPVVVGPFDLGTIVTRAAIAVDPRTAQLTITTDPLPKLVKGVPTDLRTINAVVDRPGFMFNPTDCTATAFSGTATSFEGTTAPLSTKFQVGSCQTLKFKPDFRVSTSGKTSRANGASLNAKVLYPAVAPGINQATSLSNIASVKVDLPKLLPSRLKTLQKACLAAVFEANPAGCPAASVVGHATAVTPVLAGKLVGPAYFVSHGGAAFPDLTIVLQGSGVTVELAATTFISKTGITSSTFKQVPDVPINSFELTLPKGPFSALAANGNLCKSKLAMPTAFVAHNGLVIKQSTKIKVTGCPKGKKGRKT